MPCGQIGAEFCEAPHARGKSLPRLSAHWRMIRSAHFGASPRYRTTRRKLEAFTLARDLHEAHPMNLMTGIRRIAMPLVAGALLCPMPGYADAEVQSLDAIRAAAQAYVREKIPKQEPGAVEITVGSLDARLRLAACGEPLRSALPAGATFRARMTVAVSCASGAVWTVYVPVTVETKSSVLVLRHAAARGARLAAADIEVQVRTVEGAGASYLSQVSELSGRTLKRPLAAGASLTADAFV